MNLPSVIRITCLGVATAIQLQSFPRVLVNARFDSCSHFLPTMGEMNFTHWSELPQLLRPMDEVTSAYMISYGNISLENIAKIPKKHNVVVWAHAEFSAHERICMQNDPSTMTCVQHDDCYETDLIHPNLRGKVIVSIQPPWGRIMTPDDSPEESHCYVNIPRKHSIGVPIPATFGAKDSTDIVDRMYRILSSSRTSLVTFAGTPDRGHEETKSLRQKLAQYCNASAECNFVDCSIGHFCRDNMDIVIDDYFKSEFCLMPAGDWPTRQGMFDAISTGCIPVFFSSCLREDLIYETVYAPFLPRYERTEYGPGEWAMVLDSRNLSQDSIRSALLAVDAKKKWRMRETIASLLPRIQYSKHKLVGYEDVTDVLARLLRARGFSGN